MVLVESSIYCCHTSRVGDVDDVCVCVVNVSMHNVNLSTQDQATLKTAVCFSAVEALRLIVIIKFF